NDRHHDRQLQRHVVMQDDIPEADHLSESICEVGVDVMGLGEEGEDDFAGAQDVEEGGALAGDVSGEAGQVCGVCLASACDAAGEAYRPPSSAPRIIRASSSMG
ncbi:MAG TPA: hypothetical protein PKD33_15565, partial [Rhodocyclaceae bacterium]|nr:hypothetical protein [Rhodocyclaceae bacterium]